MMRSLLRPPPALIYSRGSMAPWYFFRFAADSPLEEAGFELVVPLCLGIDIVIGDSSLVPREFGLARQAYGAIAS